jgi:hypothetical protein
MGKHLRLAVAAVAAGVVRLFSDHSSMYQT